MPMRFIQEPNAPQGMGRVVDESTGLDRMVYDPALAEQLASGYAESSEQQETIANAPDTSSVAPPAPPPEAVVAPAAPALPGAAPPVSEPQAQAWQAANSPQPPAPIVRASGNPMPPGPAPAGTVLSKAKVEMGTPGYRYDQVAEEQRGEALLDQTVELQRRADANDIVRNEQQIALEEQKAEAQRREAEAQQKATRFESELETTVKREINQDRLQENQGLFGSILGLVGQTLGYLSTPDSGFGRLQAALDRRTERDLAAQRELKDSTITMLTKQLGSAQQAENHYRAQVYATTADILETKLQRLGVADQYADKIQGLRDNALAYNEAAKAASYGKAGKAEYEFERPKPEAVKGVKPALNNDVTKRLAKIGLTPEKWTKGLDGKVLASQNAPTIAQAADTTRILDADINLFESLAAANGGKLPQKGAINVPDFLVPKLSQLGIEAGMGAEQVYQLLDGYINKQARSYGGAITDSDRDSAKRETGSSTDGLRFYLKRLRDTNNRAIRTALSQQFPGAGNEVFKILLEDSAANEGVPDVKATPMEKKNGPPAAPAKAEEPKPTSKAPARSMESITGIDDRDEEERKRRARINADAERQARRSRLEKFLQ